MKRAGRKRRDMVRKSVETTIPLAAKADTGLIIEAALVGHLRHLPISIAVWQAVSAHVRHRHSDYDALLLEGYDVDAARFFVLEDMNAVLQRWGCRRRVSADEG